MTTRFAPSLLIAAVTVVAALLAPPAATTAHPSSPPHLAITRTLTTGDTGPDVAVLQAALTNAGWPTWIDGYYGPHTTRTVWLYQRANNLTVDGIAGPQTIHHLGIATSREPALTGDGCDIAEAALRAAGGTDWEINIGRSIAWRESRCRLNVVNHNPNSRDNSWGPWQINYYGNLYNARVALLGHPTVNTSDWITAARNFLTLGRTSGWCHWNPPDYC